MDTLALLKSYIDNGNNVFLTGQGGTGKSYHIKKLIESEPNSWSITATTGIAAIPLGGRTIHSFAGLYGSEGENVQERLRYTKRLIIDEVSMFSAKEFERLDYICRALKDHKKLFGGIQVLAVGDLYQLPPVNGDFFIKSLAFFKAEFKILNLTEVKRQADRDMIDALNDIRVGNLSKRALEFFSDKSSAYENPIRLMCKNAAVDRVNNSAFDQINKPQHTLKASIKGNSKRLMREILDGILPPYALTLKIGCRVMITENARVYPNQRKKYDANGVEIEEMPEYINGDLGTFLGYYYNESSRKVKHGEEYAIKIPIDDKSEEFIEEKIIEGETRKSLQLIVNLDRGGVVYLSKHHWELGDCPAKEYRHLESYQKSTSNYNKEWCDLAQYPVKLAYGITIHKSQGMSLDAVEVDPSGAFAGGMTYVALSRATNPEGLGIKGLKKEHVFAHPDAVKFYQSLQ